MRDYVITNTFENCPEGTYQAVLIGLIDEGTQENVKFGTKEPKIVLVFEINENNSHGEHYIIYEEFSAFLSERANLRKLIDGWRGKPFDDKEIKTFNLNTIVGKHCLAGIQYNQKGYAHIKQVLDIPKDTQKMEAKTVPYIFRIDDWDAELYHGFPERIKKRIMLSPEATAATKATIGLNSEPIINNNDDDVPF